MKETFKVVMTENKEMDNSLETLLGDFFAAKHVLEETEKNYGTIVAKTREQFICGVIEQLNELVSKIIYTYKKLGKERKSTITLSSGYVTDDRYYKDLDFKLYKDGSWELVQNKYFHIVKFNSHTNTYWSVLEHETKEQDDYFGKYGALYFWNKQNLFGKLYNSLLNIVKSETMKKKTEIEKVCTRYNDLELERA